MTTQPYSVRILPFIRDLNPERDDLPAIVVLARKHAGDRTGLGEAIYEKWKRAGTRRGFTLHSVEANTVTSLGPDNLGILNDEGRLTPFGRELYRRRDKLPEFKEALAIHLLRHRAGWQFARALQVFRQRGRRPRRQDIADYLGEKYGINEWRDLNNISSLHTFLTWCGVVSNYRLNEALFENLLGASVVELSELERFTLDSRAYLEALVRLGGSGTAGAVRAAAESHIRRPLDPHELPSRMQPLVEAGLVVFRGRRGKRTGTYSVRSARKAQLLSEISSDLAAIGVVPDEVFEHDFDWVVQRLFDRSLANDEKARSLEVLAAMICWRLGLRHILLRERSPFEVDVIAEYLGTGYQVWSAQCKAYSSNSIRSEYILREFGIAELNHYSVLLFVTTAGFTEDAVFTADRIMKESPIQVITLSGEELRAIAEDETLLFRLVAAKSREMRNLRTASPPAAVFRELDAARGWLLSEKPSSQDVWLHLSRRDFPMTRPVVASLLYAWLESQRQSPGFDEGYLKRVAGER